MFKISVNTKLCKGCGICADFCPKKVYDITIGYPTVVAREADCIGCKICETKCPDFAIEVRGAKA